MQNLKTIVSLFALAGLTLSAPAQNSAQPPTPPQPQPAVPAPAPEPVKPEPRPVPTVKSADEDIKAAVLAFCGVLESKPVGTFPAMLFNSALVNVEGLDNAVYFEIARSDSHWTPFRSGIVTFFKQKIGDKTQMVMRVMDFGKLAPTFGNMTAGMYAVPEQFPLINVSSLTINCDIPVDGKDGVFAGKASIVPTMAGGAKYFSSTVKFGNDKLEWSERGIDAEGKQVWGPPSDQPILFGTTGLKVHAQRHESGLVFIDMVMPTDEKAPAAADGGEIFVHYSGWLHSDGMLFDTSRRPEREPYAVKLPGQVIAAWNQSLPGMRKGQIRRVIVPAHLGYGEGGHRRARIPANAALVFEIEAMFIRPPAPKTADEMDPTKQPPQPPPTK